MPLDNFQQGDQLARVLTDHIARFLESESAVLSPSSIVAYKARLEVFAEFIDGRNVTPLLCKNYLAHLLKTGRSRRTSAAYYAAVQSLFAWLMDTEVIKSNPVGKLKRFAIPATERQPITSEEVEKIVAQARKDGRRDWVYAVLAAWETGLRLGDVATLRWDEVNVVERVIKRMPIKTRRTGKVLEIPFSLELLQAMRDCPPFADGDAAFVCPLMAQKHAYDQHRTLSTEFIRLSRKAGVGKSCHAIRHGRVSHLLNKGVPIAVVRSITGQSLKVLQGYLHDDMDAKRAAVA